MKINKKLLTIIVGLVLISAIGIGSTLAYFTDSQEATNVITMGKVDITLTEPQFSQNHINNSITNVLPNQTIIKDPTITVDANSENAYIRASITYLMKDGTPMDLVLASQIEELIKVNNEKLIECMQWIKGENNYYYYQKYVSKNDVIKFFDTVTIPEIWGNEMGKESFDIIVKAEAIQADNFEPERNKEGQIISWGDVTIQTYQEVIEN